MSIINKCLFVKRHNEVNDDDPNDQIASTKKPVFQYEKKNFREPVKAQARAQSPHPLIRFIFLLLVLLIFLLLLLNTNFIPKLNLNLSGSSQSTVQPRRGLS